MQTTMPTRRERTPEERPRISHAPARAVIEKSLREFGQSVTERATELSVDGKVTWELKQSPEGAIFLLFEYKDESGDEYPTYNVRFGNRHYGTNMLRVTDTRANKEYDLQADAHLLLALITF